MPSPVQLIRPKRFGDARGGITEVHSVPAFAALAIDVAFVQNNHSLSVSAFTLRRTHFQAAHRGHQAAGGPDRLRCADDQSYLEGRGYGVYFDTVSNVLAILRPDEAVEADAYRRACACANDRSYDIRPAVQHVTMAERRRIVTRPPAGWQAS